MTLIKCPHCGHSVLSVASVCPTCNGSLGVTFLGPEHGGELTECRACGHWVRSGTRVCPNCRVLKPARRSWVSRPFIGASALVLAGALIASLWTRFEPPLPRNIAAVEQKPVVHSKPRAAESPTPKRVSDVLQPVRDTVAISKTEPPPPPPPRDTTRPPEPSVHVANAPATSRPGLTTKWTTLWVNVRQRPKDTAPIIRVLRPGTQIDALPRSYGWWLIFIGGDSVGYVAGGLLTSRPPSQSASLR